MAMSQAKLSSVVTGNEGGVLLSGVWLSGCSRPQERERDVILEWPPKG